MENIYEHVILGTGPVALSVMGELLKKGKAVRMVNTSGNANVPKGVQVIKANLYSSFEVGDVTKGAKVVYQCAAPRYHEWTENFQKLQDNIIEGTACNGAKLIVAENLYMYGEVDHKITEDLPYRATAKKGVIRAKLAEQLIKVNSDGKLRTASARGSDFFGPNVNRGSAMGGDVFKAISKGKKVTFIGSLDQLHSYTFIEDFGKSLVILGENDKALGEAWHVPNAPAITTRAFIIEAFNQAGNTPKMSSMGLLTLKIGGIFIPVAKEMIEMLYEFDKPFIVESSKFIKAFGDHSTPIKESISKTLNYNKNLC